MGTYDIVGATNIDGVLYIQYALANAAPEEQNAIVYTTDEGKTMTNLTWVNLPQ